MASKVKRKDAVATPDTVRASTTVHTPTVQVLTGVFGKRVRARRADLGYSQTDLAGRMTERGHGWRHGTVSRIENGQAEPSLSELVSLIVLLQASFEELTDPVLTGNGPVDIGFKEPWPADRVRRLLAGQRGDFDAT
jgi:transcriptional regulator with XRE-family HTH domain